MRFYSGFCLWQEKELFKEYLEDSEFCVAGFSYGAQKALIDAIDTNKRVDKLQLLSPAFFNLNPKFVKLQLNSFKKNKNLYIKNLIKNIKYPKEIDIEKYIDDCEYFDLEEMFRFNWGIIEHLNSVKVEVFIGTEDKIIDTKRAIEFFRKYGDVYILKNKGHLL